MNEAVGLLYTAELGTGLANLSRHSLCRGADSDFEHLRELSCGGRFLSTLSTVTVEPKAGEGFATLVGVGSLT